MPIRLAALILCLAWLQSQSLADDRPNIVVFMADDMGYADTGFTGATDIKTPNLDRLAASGVMFTSGYVTHSYCGPSRAGLLAGRYQHRFGFETNPAYDPSNPYMGIDAQEDLFPKLLQQSGYRTGVIGKWHLGAAAPFHPLNRGFDYFYGFLGGGHDYFRIDLTQPVREGYLQALERNGKPAVFDGYLTTALSRDAAEFVKSKDDQLFFLYLAYNAPHTPQQAPKEDIARYAHIKDRKRRIYAAMVDVMDAGIGRVLDALEETGQRDNTLVFFLSDNGGTQSSPQRPQNWNGSDNRPFRGGKGNLYDGGVHVPFIASWPKRIAAGMKYSKPVTALDIAATAVRHAGVPESSTGHLEGTDLIAFLSEEQGGTPHDFLYWREAGGVGWSILADDQHKHIQDRPGKPPELFYLSEDISEQSDRAAASPQLAASLREQWLEWDGSNRVGRIPGYKKYHGLRDRFFLEAIPARATSDGYLPEPIPTFK